VSCPRELRKIQLAAPAAPEVAPETKRHDPVFRAGYIHGYRDMLREALEIVEEHEDEDEGE